MAIELEVLKQGLKDSGYSFAAIAQSLELNKGTISRILDGKYTGQEATKNKVIMHCMALIEKKPVSLSDDILKHSKLYERLMLAGSLLNAFSPEEREHFIKVYKSLKQYNKNKLKKKKQAA